MLFAAGEELSWGQHLFDYHSSEFFNENNTQGETNIHNLELGGVRLNKIVFADLLGVFVFSYMVILPFLYLRSAALTRFVDSFGISVPRWRHALALIVILVLGELIKSERRSELDELTIVVVFFLTVLFPSNSKGDLGVPRGA